MVGEVLSDRYELEELVGTGGMSSVFRAHDRLLDRKVALKILHQQYGDDAEYVERFRREARSVASLSHPNVVTVIDRGEQGGRQFIVFEYVDGENLKRLIERSGPLPVDQALRLALQIARGLSFAHQQGLVHRDVKPQNVLLNGNGQAKVTDFGIARSLDVKHGMTQTGTVLGTSDYIAPEQAQGQHVDEQTDIYSLGVVLYEMLTSDVPYEGENFVAVAMQHINEPVPHVRALRPDVSRRVDAAVQRAMAKDPHDRFPTMTAFCREVEACLANDDQDTEGTQVIPPARASRRSRVSPWPVVAVVAGLLAIGAVVAVLVLTTGTGVLSIHHGGKTPPASSSGSSVALQAVNAYDPDGDGQEHNADAHLATDGNAGTYWKTESYHSSFAAIGKGGVGLILDAGSTKQLHEIGVVSATPGFQAVIKAGDSPSGPFDAVVSSPQTAQEQTRFTITGDPHRYYLLWITALPSQLGSVQINEIRAS
jgi:serine/threonine-protein kinase